MKTALHAIIRALGTLTEPEIRKLIVLSLAATLAVLLLFVGAVQWVLLQVTLVDIGWLDGIIDFIGGAGTLLIAWLLFPVLMPLIASLFEDRIAGKVEAHAGFIQPANPPAQFWSDLRYDMRFLAVSLGFNLLLLPFLFLPPVYMVLYLLVNGYLLGREFFAIVGGRHIGRNDANRLRKRHRLTVWLAGVAIAGLMLVPLANLLGPFIGLAAMVYVFHGIEGHTGQQAA